MTTRWADGFEDTAAADLGTDYAVTGGFGAIVTGRRTGTFAYKAPTSANHNLRRTIGGTEATLFQSCAVNLQTLPTPAMGKHFMRFMEGSTIHIALFATAAGGIAVYRGDFTTLLGTTAAFFSPTQWTWLQVKVVIHDTTGSVEIRDASGSVLIALTGIDTKNGGTGYVDVVSVGHGGNSNVDTYFDDWHVWDTTGSICNTWTNDTRIDHRLPTGAGTYAQFTASAGANYACVDDVNYNATDYVESSVAGHKDTYAFADITHAPPSIFSVLVTAVALKDDAGARSLKDLVRSGAADYAGSATTLNQGSYTRAVGIREADPATGVAWTQSGYNAAEFGFENV